MKKTICFALFFALLSGLYANNRYLVAVGGSGDGSSWGQAFGDLQQALAIASSGDEIWVAAGTYKPSSSLDRNASFHIPVGVSLWGGFNGTETDKAARDWQQNSSILSGDLGLANEPSDNSQTIIYFDQATAGTVLDGFVIEQATANAFARGADPGAAGAAIFNNGANGTSSPLIRNCTFRDNRAREGAAIYNYSANGRCEPQIINCQFIRNEANFNGGAIFNNGDDGICNPKIINCRFIANKAVYGASLLNSARLGECIPLIESSVFKENRTSMGGTVVYNKLGNGDRVYAILTDCTIEENYPAVGTHLENNGRTAALAAGVKPVN